MYAYSGEFDCTTPEDDDDGDVKVCVCVCVQYENRKSRGDLFIYCIYYHFFFFFAPIHILALTTKSRVAPGFPHILIGHANIHEITRANHRYSADAPCVRALSESTHARRAPIPAPRRICISYCY